MFWVMGLRMPWAWRGGGRGMDNWGRLLGWGLGVVSYFSLGVW